MTILRMIFFLAISALVMGCVSDFNRAEVIGQSFPRDAWIDLETRAFKSTRYDSRSQQFDLVFNTGTIHSYEHFPESEFNRFMASGGKWGFYKAQIRDAYPCSAQHPPKKPGSFSAVRFSMWNEPVRVFHYEAEPEEHND